MPADYLGFMTSQTALIRSRIYALKYPAVDFTRLVPVNTEGSGWESGIEHFSSDMVGKMEEISPQTTKLPLVELTHDQHFVRVASYGAALKFNIVEVNQALMIPNMNLRSRKEQAMRRAHDQTHWDLVLQGRSDLGWDGLINSSAVTAVDAKANGTGNSREWEDKTAENILLDINEALEGIYTASNTVEMGDTIALPPGVWANMASKFIAGTAQSVARWIMENNVYSLQTGRKLTIMEIRGLESAAAGNTGRMIAYRKAPDVLEYHLLLPLMLLDSQMEGFDWMVPALTRTGGLEIKLPKAIRYVDLISP